jgi:signal transduction histidine kinase
MTHMTLSLGVAHSSAMPDARSALQRTWRSAMNRVLRIPLILKLLGANLLLALAVLAVAMLSPRAPMPLLVTWIALLVSFAVSALLVRLVLLPIDELEHVARAVASGNLAARVTLLPTADRQVAKLGDAFNHLLAGAAHDRAQIQHLVRESLRARERERSALSTRLRDSTAQQLSAITLQLAAATTTQVETERMSMIAAARSIASELMDDVRTIADSVYPGLLGRFGLYPALEALGRRLQERSGIPVRVDTSLSQRALPLMITTAFYGVAEEALRNVEQHSCARSAVIAIVDQGDAIELVVEDNGTGFDPVGAEGTFSGIGLFRARELLAHAGGELTIISAPGQGTKVIATAALQE